MMSRTRSPWSLARSLRSLALPALAAATLALGCESGGVGDPCVPEDEYQQEFSGYSSDEVNVESRSFQCETRVCLVNKFQGRVSCPYGQSANDLEKPGTSPERCRIPGTSGEREVDQITAVVNPQLIERRADKAVYCSCRCAGPDPNARYCECPSGFKCTALIDDLGLGNANLAGSYCVKDGTQGTLTSNQTCNPNPASPEFCGGDGANP